MRWRTTRDAGDERLASLNDEIHDAALIRHCLLLLLPRARYLGCL